MRRRLPAGPVALRMALVAALAGGALAAPLPPQTAPTTAAGVLAALDAAAPGLHAVSARVQVEDYTALVHDSSRSSGSFYYRRGAHGPMYALRLTSPPEAARELLYRDQTAWLYTPASKEVMRYDLRGRTALVDQYLTLGMGASGQEMARAFTVQLDPPETLDGVATVKLTLTPRVAAVAQRFPQIVLWLNPATWLAVQQQMFQPGGDYHRVRYSAVGRNPEFSDQVFSTNFAGAKIVPGN